MKRIKQALLFIMAVSTFIVHAAGCATTGSNALEVTDRRVIHDEEFGGVYIDLTIDEFDALGFAFGDSLDISFSNGYQLKDIPYYNGYYAPAGDPMLVGYKGYPYINASISGGPSLWEIAGLAAGDRAEILLVQKGKYLDTQEIRNISYEDDRSLYPDDAVFANFRCVHADGIRENTLYRSASPCDNQHNRADYADRLAEEAGIGFILDLADTDEKILSYRAMESFDSPCFWSLYSSGNVAPIAMSVDYCSEENREKLAKGLIAMEEHEGPYLIHCTEGKDRTGFVCMLLEALCGAGLDEIEQDYMTTYDNYYGINRDTDEKRYRIIVDNVMIPLIHKFVDEDVADLENIDLSPYAAKFLMQSGLTDGHISLIKSRLK